MLIRKFKEIKKNFFALQIINIIIKLYSHEKKPDCLMTVRF